MSGLSSQARVFDGPMSGGHARPVVQGAFAPEVFLSSTCGRGGGNKSRLFQEKEFFMYWDKLKPENCFFVQVDFQACFSNLVDPKIVRLAQSNVRLMLDMFKTLGIPCIGTEHYRKGLGRTMPEILEKWHGSDIRDKLTFSCLGCDELVRDLENLGDRKIAIVAGIETHVCVLQTALDLLRRGCEVLVINDAVLSSSKLKWENGLQLAREAGARVVNTETLIFYLLQRVDRPEFKPLVKLLKEQKVYLSREDEH
jgi:nicotinamidase-related amidase